MKEVVSVSLGSSQRDHEGILELGEEKVKIRREGVDGDMKAYFNRYAELDGTVDALGVGGLMFSFHVNNRVYDIRVAKKIKKVVTQTPVVDGDGVKDAIERTCMQTVWPEIEDLLEGKPKTATATVAIDRYGMTQSVIDTGYETIFGDLPFGLGININVKSIKTIHRIARLTLPLVSQFPISWLYPVGSSQDKFTPKYPKLFESTIIAGDFLYIKKYAPMDMKGKILVTNTTTASDIEEFKNRGVSAIVTTTPDVGGRSFGANGLEAAIVAYSGKGRPLTSDEMLGYAKELNLRPQVIRFD